MTTLPPSPFTDSGVPSDSPPDEAATPTGLQASGVAAEISLSELIDRGFDVEAFMLAIEPPPLFLQRVG
jgi:hypothetical protein